MDADGRRFITADLNDTDFADSLCLHLIHAISERLIYLRHLRLSAIQTDDYQYDYN